MSAQPQQSTGKTAYNSVLVALLLLLLGGVLTFDRSKWPTLVGDESTYLMMAASLAWDRDLRYERRDYDRFVEQWGLEPEGLILQSGDAGQRITFGKPFFYPLWMAPMVRIWPTGGPFLANWTLLAIAALLVTRTLRQTVGAAAPLWVTCFLFASISFAYTFWAHADLFLMAATGIALSLAFYRQAEETAFPRRWGRRLVVRWLVAGGLLALVAFSRPLYLPLYLPILFVLPRNARTRAATALLVGTVGMAVGATLVHRLNAGAWTSYGAQRRGFYSSTGFPAVHFPVEEWSASLDDLGDAAWAEARTLTTLPDTDPALWRWNGVYFVLGRHVGVLPYFLPLTLGLLGRPRGMARWMLLVGVGISVTGFFLYRPFNFYGGGGALANRYFLALYPAFWFMASRPCRPRRFIAICLLAAPFLWPIWRSPRAFPQRANHTYRYVSAVAARLLPYETTQSHLKPGGRADVVHGQLWVKFLTPTLRQKRDGSALLLDRGSRGQLLLAAEGPRETLELRTLGDPAEAIEVVGGATLVSEERTEHGRLLQLELDGPRARHPMWWTWETVYLYQLTLRSEATGEGRITFTLR